MDGEATRSSDEAVRKLGTLIHGIKSAIMVSHFEDGSLHARPMATQQVDFDGDLWFFSQASSHKISELLLNPQVCITYSEPKDNRFVAVYGSAAVRRDEAKTRELWNPLLKAWFPRGLDDPDLCLIQVHVERAEYWDAASSTLVQVVGFAKAVLTGERYNPAGQHGHLDLGTPAH